MENRWLSIGYNFFFYRSIFDFIDCTRQITKGTVYYTPARNKLFQNPNICISHTGQAVIVGTCHYNCIKTLFEQKRRVSVGILFSSAIRLLVTISRQRNSNVAVRKNFSRALLETLTRQPLGFETSLNHWHTSKRFINSLGCILKINSVQGLNQNSVSWPLLLVGDKENSVLRDRNYPQCTSQAGEH